MLTIEQRAAIECRDSSVALSAGAGCGKTHVLTARFLSHLDAGANGDRPATLGQLIAITFTDAAAREMRSRIRAACYDQLRSAKTAEEQDHWLRLLREIESARISTIHAFCAALLRTHAATAGLDPTFAVMDQGETDVLQSQIMDDVLRERLAELDPDALDLAAAFGLARLKDQVAALLHHRHDAAFDDWLSSTPDELVSQWAAWHKREAFPLALREMSEDDSIDAMLQLLRGVDTAGRKPKFAEARAILLELLPKIKSHTITSRELDLVREWARVQTICTAKDWPEGYQPYQEACKKVRALIDNHKPRDFDPAAARPSAVLGLALLRLTSQVVERYNDRKHAQGKLDFDDLLSQAHKLLAAPENDNLRKQLSGDLRLLLVDEFQDTDELQAELVKRVCGPEFAQGPLFFVGDFKQSIYRFRGAEPSVFRELRQQISKTGQLPLTKNFRSQPAILHFVNALFADEFNRDGDRYEPLHANREQATDEPAIEFLWTIDAEKNNNKIAGSTLEARRKEARAIAIRLRTLLAPDCAEKPVIDKETEKPRQLKPGDVAILFRALSDVQVYEEALREYELDYYLVGGHAFYAQQEIFDVLNLLRAVASTADEVSLAGVLRSPFFSLEDETLFWLVDERRSLNAGLLAPKLPSQLSKEERAKTIAAAATIGHLREIKDRVPIAMLLATALDRTGYDAVLLTEFLGQRKLANLQKLVERARAADHGNALDLDGFITELSQFIVQQPQESLAATLPEAADVIRLMTIHHAKGLEFPFVIVPDLDRRNVLQSPPAALSRELGPLVPLPSDEEDRKVSTGMSMYVAAERAEDAEERKRLLYVACTRAADYLVLSSSIEACDKPRSDWLKLIGGRFNLADGQLIAGLPSDYEAPHVRVTTDPQTNYKPVGRSRGPDLVRMLEEAQHLATQGDSDLPSTVAPVSADATARRQFSVSRLAGHLIPLDGAEEVEGAAWEGEALAEPETEGESKPSPFGRGQGEGSHSLGFGTLVHDVLARIDFRNPASVAAWCEHLAPQHVPLHASEAAERAREMIERYLASPDAHPLADATALHREVEFLLAWPGEPASAGGACDLNSYLRGYIDCLYQNPDGTWHLADFKTNRITADQVAATAERYKLQMYVYALATEQALGQSPTGLTLHFLHPGKPHPFPWNDTARQTAIDLVNRAIANLQQLVASPQSPAPSP